MHFARTLTQKLNERKGRTRKFLKSGRRRRLEKLARAQDRRLSALVETIDRGERAVGELTHAVDDHGPSVDFAGDELLHHAERILFLSVSESQRTHERRHVREGMLGRELATDFDLRIFAFVELSINLEIVLVAEKHRRIALL